MNSDIKVLFAGSYPIFLKGLSTCLSITGVTVQIAASMEEAQKILKNSIHILVIVSLALTVDDAFELCRWCQENSHAKVIIVSVFVDNPLFVIDAISTGARACISPQASQKDWLQLISDVINNRTCFPQERIAEASLPIRLSLCEVDVLRFIADGKTDKEIAALLDKSVNTVRSQAQSAIEKLQVDNRKDAVHRARHRGFI